MFAICVRTAFVVAAVVPLVVPTVLPTAIGKTGLVGYPAIRILSLDQCPPGRYCAFRDANFEGGGVAITDDTDLNSLEEADFNDQMSSWANFTSSRMCWYSEDNFEGSGHVMDTGESMGSLPGNENDTASSLGPC